jgi:hypothetical protein
LTVDSDSEESETVSMQKGVENESNRSEDHPATLMAVNNGDGAQASDEVRRRSSASHQNGGQSIPDAVVGFVERNPVVAAGAALAVGAAVVMLVQSRRSASGRIDRRVQRAVRSMDQTFSREMKALRRSDMADRLGQFGNTLGDAFSRIDLSPLAERGREYLDEARRRFRA